MPGFEFVHVNQPGDEKKYSTKIRRHVMKDIGRSRRKPKKRCETTVSKLITGTGHKTRSRAEHDQALVPCPLVESKLSDIVYPVEMDEERRNLARYLFAEARSSYRPFRVPWLSVALTDAAAWYITLANAVISRQMRPGDAESESRTGAQARKLYTLSLRSISKRLGDPTERRKEGLIAAITCFICHDSSIGNFTQQMIHLQGLKRLVDDIGGINEIANPILRFMISWYDLSGAAYRNSPPNFGVPTGSITDIDTRNDATYFKLLLGAWDHGCPYLGDIQSALIATAAVASYVNRHCEDGRFWTDDIAAARLLAPALHEVLNLDGRALPSDPSHRDYSGIAAREAFRRSALVFLAALRGKFGAALPELGRHLGDFRQICGIPHVDWAFVPELNLWAHAIAALGEESSEQRDWHVSAIVSIMESAGFTSSQQALGVVRGIIWIEALFVDKVETLGREIDNLVAVRRTS
ncbi:hypothetical protein F4802DRAFT_254737 [Xylaria palmicola]|nr:hypothetical protein F4802DRAFT_254737 [Xylaria palmicola]